MGLPLAETAELLARAGVEVWHDASRAECRSRTVPAIGTSAAPPAATDQGT
jgi:hypothetical protein